MNKIIIKFKILGKSWQLRLLTKDHYKNKHGWDSVAITLMYKSKIDLSPKGLNTETIIHELVHAYMYELCTYSADLDVDAKEEIFAELMAKRGYELLKLADKLMLEIEKRNNKYLGYAQ